MLTTIHAAFSQYGIPESLIPRSAPCVFISQDAHTRQHYSMGHGEFAYIASDAWRIHPIDQHSYTGSIAVIDPATRTVCHIYDPDQTTPSEVVGCERLIVDKLIWMVRSDIAFRPK